MGSDRNIRVLVIDDSAYNRRTLSELLERESDITVVGKACDGEEGLALTLKERPDVITLDLEMPRMDGFTFLRIVMARRPTPIIVISSHANRENVFRALELGALDFVAKPSHRITPAIKEISEEVVKKVRLARLLKKDTLLPMAPFDLTGGKAGVERPRFSRAARRRGEEQNRCSIPAPHASESVAATRIIAIAASTGGPAALTRILTALPADLPAGIVIAQHMPPSFTTTFAERLDRQCAIRVREVTGPEPLLRGSAYLAPGDASLVVSRGEGGLAVLPIPPDGTERYVPSADRLFSSVAAAVGREALGIVLTGMGDDGSRGAKEIAAMGGKVIAEDESTAVIAGMPRSAVASGAVDHVLPLHNIASFIMSHLSR